MPTLHSQQGFAATHMLRAAIHEARR